MKNLTNLFGFSILLLGFCFKMMHWPGATFALVIGAVIAAISAMLPKDKLKRKNSHDVLDNLDQLELEYEDAPPELTKKGESIRSVGIGIVIIGILFRIQHWPYGSVILIVGVIVSIIGGYVRYFQNR